MYRIVLSRESERGLDALEEQDRKRVLKKLKVLSGNPRIRGTEKLTNEDNLYKNRVGKLRIIFQIKDDVLILLIVRVDHRREAYRRRG